MSRRLLFYNEEYCVLTIGVSQELDPAMEHERMAWMPADSVILRQVCSQWKVYIIDVLGANRDCLGFTAAQLCLASGCLDSLHQRVQDSENSESRTNQKDCYHVDRRCFPHPAEKRIV